MEGNSARTEEEYLWSSYYAQLAVDPHERLFYLSFTTYLLSDVYIWIELKNLYILVCICRLYRMYCVYGCTPTCVIEFMNF